MFVVAFLYVNFVLRVFIHIDVKMNLRPDEGIITKQPITIREVTNAVNTLDLLGNL